VQISDRPFIPTDFEYGRKLFLGTARQQNGGPSCISCHAVGDHAGLGGGRLGPDLTKVYERLGGRKPLSAWLAAPATPTMQAVFAAHPLNEGEILALVALFSDQAQNQLPTRPPQTFIILGLIGAIGMLFMLNYMWQGRIRSIRHDLLNQTRLQEGD
jgi:cytochrome c peroxidase